MATAAALAAISARALASPPTAEDFGVLYRLTDEQGEVGRQMSSQDLQNFINQARCECGQTIDAKITLTGSGVDSNQVSTYVGQQCDVAQSNFGSPYAPCARITVGLPQSFQNGPNFAFDPIWLAWGAEGDQAIEDAVPVGACAGTEGAGGLWMCDGVEACNEGQFFMTGTTNLNVPEGDTPVGINFDFIPPVVAPTNYSASAGDGAVEIRWDIETTAAINGYRVLCADEDGDPIDNGEAITSVAIDRVSDGTIYFTRNNLCPGGRFGPDYDPNDDGWPEDPPDDTGGETDSDSAGGTESGDGSDTGGADLPAAGLLSLDWAYVCSPHLGGNTTKARISGLDNDRRYQFIVVAYDLAGNPVAGAEPIFATPVETNDLWEQCEEQGDVCGEAGYCSVGTRRSAPWLLVSILAVGVGAVAAGRRVRRRARP